MYMQDWTSTHVLKAVALRFVWLNWVSLAPLNTPTGGLELLWMSEIRPKPKITYAKTFLGGILKLFANAHDVYYSVYVLTYAIIKIRL